MIYQKEKDPLLVCAESELEATARAVVGYLKAGQVRTSKERSNCGVGIVRTIPEARSCIDTAK